MGNGWVSVSNDVARTNFAPFGGRVSYWFEADGVTGLHLEANNRPIHHPAGKHNDAVGWGVDFLTEPGR
nr:hypothetical protein [uncultured Kocuria sp.]